MKNQTELKIEHGVPPPPPRISGITATLRKMKPGDSFILPHAAQRRGVHAIANQLHMHVAVRTSKEGCRVWRTA